jgi:hypothetical protein
MQIPTLASLPVLKCRDPACYSPAAIFSHQLLFWRRMLDLPGERVARVDRCRMPESPCEIPVLSLTRTIESPISPHLVVCTFAAPQSDHSHHYI